MRWSPKERGRSGPVNQIGDRFQMDWIHACSVTAEMVYLKTRRDSAALKFPRYSVSLQSRPAGWRSANHPIAIIIK